MDEATLIALRRAIDSSSVVEKVRREKVEEDALRASCIGMLPQYRTYRAFVDERTRELNPWPL
jgi:hypothetical protein